jgi:TnpA family transposase
MVSDQAVGLAGRVLSGTPRDSLHMIDLIYSEDAGQRPEVITTDTGSYSDIAFGLSRCWTSVTARSSPPSPTPAVAHRPNGRYGPLNGAPCGKIDLGSIRRQRPDILRVVASTHTGAVAGYDILRVLAPGGTPMQLGDRLRTTAGSSDAARPVLRRR